MPYCPHCGAPFTSGASYCPSCGAPLPTSSEDPSGDSSPFESDSDRSDQPSEEPISTSPVQRRQGNHFAEPAEPQYPPVPASQTQSDWTYDEETVPATWDGKPEGGAIKQSWHDFISSPGKVGVVVKLSLMLLIPIVGPIMFLGYVYTWGADRAYGNRVPLPRSVFAGLYLKNGWYVTAVNVAWGLLISLAEKLVERLSSVVGIPDMIIVIVSLVVSLLLGPLLTIMIMNSIIYRSMGKGFDVKMAWSMYFQSGKFGTFLTACLAYAALFALVCIADVFVATLPSLMLGLEILPESMTLLCILVFALLLFLLIPILAVYYLLECRAVGAVMADVLAEQHL